MISPKLKVKWAAGVFAVLATIGQINSLAPSLQDKFTQALLAVFPVTWRPEISAICNLVAVCAAIYALVNASHSGPMVQPQSAEDKTQPTKPTP